jgi:hypothetical protein
MFISLKQVVHIAIIELYNINKVQSYYLRMKFLKKNNNLWEEQKTSYPVYIYSEYDTLWTTDKQQFFIVACLSIFP